MCFGSNNQFSKIFKQEWKIQTMKQVLINKSTEIMRISNAKKKLE